MKTYLLKRFSMTDKGTFGVMLDENNIPLVLTLEEPWMENQHDISCVPSGTYKAQRIDSPAQRKQTPDNGDRFMLTGVPNRDFVEIHVGNTLADTKGCILVGLQFDGLTIAGGTSTPAFKKLMDSLSGEDSFSLRIVEV